MPRWLVAESVAFAVDLRTIGPPAHDWTESIAGIRWYLERAPLAFGHGTQDSEVRIFMLDTPGDLPNLKVFYVVEGARVTLLRARAVPPRGT